VSLDLRLYVILDVSALRGRLLERAAAEAIEGGATMLQIRGKDATTRRLLDLTGTALAIARPAAVPVIVNDRIDVALACGAHGVHLGDDDMPVDAAREILGGDTLLGFSAGDVQSARSAEVAGADYLGTGDVFGTASKLDADLPIGLDGLSRVVESVSLPVVAIGGIGPGRAEQAIAAGAAGVAVISAVLGADDMVDAARNLAQEVNRALARRGES
jgi:thiamine-phosphate pyrophosphorylase